MGVGFLFSCATSGEDDSGDGASASDDDAATDDDNVSDDDNDNDDNDDNDDDTTVPPMPGSGLLLYTDADLNLRSWMRTENGWEEMAVPAAGFLLCFGPVLLLDGSHAYSAVNRTKWVMEKGMSVSTSNGHSWLRFDWQNGWRLDPQRSPAGNLANISHLGLTSDGVFWTGAEEWYSEMDSGVGPGLHYEFLTRDRLFHYTGNQAIADLTLAYLSVTAMAVPAPDFGQAWAEKNMLSPQEELWRFDGLEWTLATIPPAMAGGAADWFWFTDAANGYAAWRSKYLPTRRLFRFGDGEWTEVPAPAGCETVTPTQVQSFGGYAVGIDTSRRTSRFWEYREGQWQCRNAALLDADWTWFHAAVTTDERAYAIVKNADGEPKLIEITAGAVNDISLPAEVTMPIGVLVLGEDAPPIGYAPLSPNCLN
ncbi:MAG: hypothetical protein GX444_02575 [Myxococcales bacterium]|nr:hypothetical protein [Myxococcales bacterium]